MNHSDFNVVGDSTVKIPQDASSMREPEETHLLSLNCNMTS
jgi:hypothetical protein